MQVPHTSAREGMRGYFDAKCEEKNYFVPFNLTFLALLLLATQYASLACVALHGLLCCNADA